jgi:predicted butyrate kinase (DUF1464 family)
MVRVAGTDPGTSSLDVIVLEDGVVRDQCRFKPEDLRANPLLPVAWLEEQEPFDLIAGPSGYGLPLVRAQDCTARELALMTLVRPDDQGPGRQGVLGFSGVLQAFVASTLPVVFLPGVIHLSTVPAYRKTNRIDMGTPDKLSVAALALDQYLQRAGGDFARCNFCVVELGTAFTACVVCSAGRIVDALGGTSGPYGWRSGGMWDGELAYLLSPLTKKDLFTGGVLSQRDDTAGHAFFCESLVKSIAGLRAVTAFDEVIASGRLLEVEPEFGDRIVAELTKLCRVVRLQSLPGAWVKHAAQGAALMADGLAGGLKKPLVDQLALRQSAGTVLDWVHNPRIAELRAAFGLAKGG